MPPRERFTTTLDSDLLEKLKILAIYEKRPVNKILDEAIKDLLKKYEKKPKKSHGRRA
jgi:predicted transcriptional regulator